MWGLGAAAVGVDERGREGGAWGQLGAGLGTAGGPWGHTKGDGNWRWGDPQALQGGLTSV